MTKRREFLRNTLLSTAALSLTPALSLAESTSGEKYRRHKLKHYVWVQPNKLDTEAGLHTLFQQFSEAGIKGIFIEADSQMHFKIAKKYKLETHRWIWTLNRGDADLLKDHPDWYAVSRKGDSCAIKPPYVSYYRWLCPSKPSTLDFLSKEVNDILSKDYVDGIQLDYIRYCDVILAINLWKKYNIVQTAELPEYDFCYCDHCQQKFHEWSGETLSDIEYPQESLSWRHFRYNQVNDIVNHLAKIAKQHGKPITATGFPTPEVARRLVRQDWTNWNIEAMFPQFYHGFYNENLRWIGDAVKEGVHFLNGKFPLYAGIYLPDFKDNQQIQEGIEYALNNGASGMSFFGKVTPEVLRALTAAVENIKRK
ncbi:family 10 glycosylhydrolase [Arachidicoccus sp.]|uniref:family 10 glycosylhydrolase n=1 Tax=Arachidicoccus sp. TaxID=1872624 RepID=UPI003D19A2C7